MRKFLPLFLLFSFLADADESVIVLRAARMLDVRAGVFVPNPVIVIENDRILAVNPEKEPANGQVLDLGDVTVMPGLIDAHTHLTYDADDYRLDLGKQPYATPAGRALVGAKNARITLQAGFTTVRDLGACCFADVTLQKAIEKGHIDGPRIIASAHIIATTGGNCDQTIVQPDIVEGSPLQGIADDRTEIVEAIRLQIKYGAGVIKTCADGNQFTEEELRLMAEIAHQRKVKLAVHVWEPESVLRALNAGADSIEHAMIFTPEVIKLMVKKQVFLVPTMYTIDGLNLEKLPPRTRKRVEPEIPLYKESFRMAVKAGVKIAFGSDSGQIPHGENAKEFGSMVSYGMTPLEAIRSATLNAADLLSAADRGTIENGKLADIIAVPGDPLKDVTVLQKVSFVMKGGKIYRHVD
jgi:imidazolonepropionase-like amidohydrolase